FPPPPKKRPPLLGSDELFQSCTEVQSLSLTQKNLTATLPPLLDLVSNVRTRIYCSAFGERKPVTDVVFNPVGEFGSVGTSFLAFRTPFDRVPDCKPRSAPWRKDSL